MIDKTYKLKTSYIFLFFFVLYCIVLLNLFSLQIRQHEFYKEIAAKQYLTTVTTYPSRASIFDRNGTPLALNRESIAAFIMPKTLEDPKKLEGFLKKHFPEAVERFQKKKQANFVYIKRNLTEKEQNLITNAGIPDIHFLTEPRRFYPIESTGSLIGITDIDNQGIFGFELLFNTQLAGTPTTTLLEKDARSGRFYFSQQTTESGSLGTPVTLTIDADIQFLVQEELNNQAEKYHVKEAAAVVMDPITGDIIAMASYPTFNPNETTNLELSATKNTAVTESYEFGSALKTFCALAALEEGVVTADEEINCLNTKTAIVEGRTINTVYADGIIPFTMVIQRSNNIGIAKVAKRLGTKLYDHYKKMGFGAKTGIPFQGEQAGFVNHPKNWSKQSIISLSYGYEITTTLLRLTTSFCLFANNGYLIQPRLVINPEQPHKEPIKIYSDKNIEIMRDILEKSTSTLAGTGKHAAIKGYRTLGKTSTANLLEHGVYNPHKNFYGFIGSIEEIKDSNGYKRVIGCYLKESPRHGLYAGTVAAPLFHKIAEKLLLHDKVLLTD